MTTVANVPLDDDGLRALAGPAQEAVRCRRLGKDGVIELQGNHRETVMEVLAAAGYGAVRAGGRAHV